MPFDGKIADFRVNTVADALRRAKALIDTPEKWGKDSYGFGNRPKCAMGALAAVNVGVNDSIWFASSFLEAVTGAGCIESWNDEPERTHADVMSAFDKAIALAESE